jgi:hypothetical protein
LRSYKCFLPLEPPFKTERCRSEMCFVTNILKILQVILVSEESYKENQFLFYFLFFLFIIFYFYYIHFLSQKCTNMFEGRIVTNYVCSVWA